MITPEVRSRIKWGSIIIGIIAVYVVLNFLRSIYTDWLWFNAVNHSSVFQTILTTRILLFLGGGGLVGLLTGASIYFAHKFAAGPDEISLPASTQKFLKSLTKWGSTAVAIVIGVIFGVITASKWELFLKFENSVSFDVTEPLYDKDLGFYVFTFPLFEFIQGSVLTAAVVIGLTTLLTYFVIFNIRGVGFLFTPGFKAHISIIGAVLMSAIAAGHWVDRWGLLMSNKGAIYGAAYTDVHATMPALLILTIVALASALLMLANIYQRSVRLLVGGVGLWIVMAIVLGAGWPNAMQRFTVAPNEYARELPFIERNIEFTRRGFGLHTVTEKLYPVTPVVTSDLLAQNSETVDNIRLWDHGPISTVYKQIQQIRPYYDFNEADVDRYTIDDKYRQVMLAAREVNPDQLNEDAQTWVNRRLRYTHGFGIAMSPVTEFNAEGRPEFFAKDIPSSGKITIGSDGEAADIIIENPRIYYGEKTVDYVVVNSNTLELDYQTEGTETLSNKYSGNGGVDIGSLLRRVAYAWQFGDLNLLITGEINEDSKLQYRRQIQERVSTVAPFLRLDSDPYIVATPDSLVWIQDAYTVSQHYPYSDPFDDRTRESIGYNYIRNSVKVIVDAFDGTTTFYVADSTDPVIQAYQTMFPDLFLPFEAIPEVVKSHIRYPFDLFFSQSNKYLRYHMLDPLDFYNLEDIWNIPTEKFGQSASQLQSVEPYYAIMKLPGESQEEFVLLIPYTRNDPPIMAGWLAARNDAPHYGELVAYDFPKERQVDSPEQIEAKIDNDPTISEWFTLRCQEGSQCLRGNLLVLPIAVGDEFSLLYAEPVYLQAEGIEFPELKQVILATGDRVVMEGSVPEAVRALVAGDPLIKDEVPSHQPVPNTGKTPIEEINNAIQGLRDSISALEKALQNLN